MTSSKDPNHRTPRALIRALDPLFPIVLDLAATKANAVAQHYFGPDHKAPHLRDALAVRWAKYFAAHYHTHGGAYFAFLNPPWSREQKQPIEPWIEKCWKESQRGLNIVAVLPASIQTAWWAEFVWNRAYEVRFFPHRLSFDRADGGKQSNANFNSAIVVWRPLTGFSKFRTHVNYWSYR